MARLKRCWKNTGCSKPPPFEVFRPPQLVGKKNIRKKRGCLKRPLRQLLFFFLRLPSSTVLLLRVAQLYPASPFLVGSTAASCPDTHFSVILSWTANRTATTCVAWLIGVSKHKPSRSRVAKRIIFDGQPGAGFFSCLANEPNRKN